jgi:hypothetical protein
MVWTRQKELDRCNDARVTDLKDLVGEVTRCITQSSQHIALSTAAMDTMNRANDGRLTVLERLVELQRNTQTELQAANAKIEVLTAELRRLN